MDNERAAGQARRRDQAGSDWDAVGSLKRNAKRPKDEVTPLLGNSGRTSSEDGSNGPQEPQWEGHADFEGVTWWHKPSLYWLLPAFFLFATAFGGIIVPKLNLTLSLICREYLIERASKDPSFVFMPIALDADNPQCRKIPEVQALASKFQIYLMTIPGILSAIVSPRLGALSDRHGRIHLLAVTSIGLFLSEIITILAATFPETVSYQWMLAGAVFDGVCGSFTAAMAIVHAYASDCTAPPKRAIAFGYFHACLFSGIALGPLFAAFMVRVTGQLITIFYCALGVHAFFIFFVFFVVPESLSKKRQQLAKERYIADGQPLILDGYRHNAVFQALREMNILAPLKILWPTGPGSSSHLRANLILLSAVDTIIFGVAMGSMTVVVYYTGYQFGWDTAESSVFISIVATARVSALIIILPIIIRIVRTRRANKQRRESGFAIPERNSGSDTLDLSIVRFSIFLEILGFTGYVLARQGSAFIFSGILSACGGVGSPTLQSALTKHVPHDRVGQVLGANGLLHALARVVAPALFNLIYAKTVGTFPQAVFVVLASCFGLAFLVSWFIRPNVYLEDTNETTAYTPRGATEPTPDTLVDEEIAEY